MDLNRVPELQCGLDLCRLEATARSLAIHCFRVKRKMKSRAGMIHHQKFDSLPKQALKNRKKAYLVIQSKNSIVAERCSRSWHSLIHRMKVSRRRNQSSQRVLRRRSVNWSWSMRQTCLIGDCFKEILCVVVAHLKKKTNKKCEKNLQLRLCFAKNLLLVLLQLADFREFEQKTLRCKFDEIGRIMLAYFRLPSFHWFVVERRIEASSCQDLKTRNTFKNEETYRRLLQTTF